MKTKTLHLIASTVLLSVAFASCMDEAQELAIEQPQTLKQIVMTTQDFVPEASGRTLYEITDEVTQCTWATCDTVGVFPDEGAQVFFPMASGAGTKNATFNGGGWALKDASTYAAYYPCIGKFYLDKNAVSVSYSGQKQMGDASTVHLGTYDYMVSAPTAPQDGYAQFMFKHLSALVQLKITLPEPAILTSVKLVTDTEAFAVEGKVDIMADEPSIVPVVSGNEMVLNLQDVATTEENQLVTLYMMLPPVDLSEQTLKVVIATDKGDEEIALEGKNFQAGTVYSLSGALEISGDVGFQDGVVRIAKAGTMQKLLGSDYLNLTSLKVVGPINGDDVYVLRQMLSTQLTTLDLAEATIVEGGRAYYENENFKHCTSDDVIGDRMFASCNELQSIVLPDNATAIGKFAFGSCDALSSVIIGKGITSIGDDAFVYCDALTSIDIPENVTSIGEFAFSLSSLTSIVIPDGVTSIGQRAFSECYSLASVTIGKGVTTLANGVFAGCYALTSIDIPDNVITIDTNVFWACEALASVTIGDGVTSIGGSAFSRCPSITSVTMGKAVTSIGNSAFSGCSLLTSLNLPDGLVSIGENAFSRCSSLTIDDIPDGVTSIGKSAFYGCSSLTSVNVPDGVTFIDESTFFGCSSLTSVTVGKGVTSIGAYAFEGCSSLASVDILGDLTSIAGHAFCGCSSLVSIDLPTSVKAIGIYAFSKCSSLVSIELPAGIISVRQRVFSHCSSLASVTIGGSVTSIGDNAFWGCHALTDFYSLASTPPKINKDYPSFESNGMTLHVPAGCSSAYKSSDWGTYFTAIVEME